MKHEDLNKKYMEAAYRLYQLFETRKEMVRKYPDEFEVRYHRDDKKEYKMRIEKINTAIKDTKAKLLRIAHKAAKNGVDIPVENILKRYNLGSEERDILLLIYFKELERGRFEITGRELLTYLGYQTFQFIEKSEALENLLKKKLVECEFPYSCDEYILEAEFALSSDTFKNISGKVIIEEVEEYDMPDRFTKFASRRFADRKRSFLKIYEPELSFDQIVLPAEKLKAIERAIFQAKNLGQIFEKWGLNSTIKYGKGTILLFYGPPGTGKTATSEAIAHRLGKKIGIANYENILNCFVGGSEKNLTLVFEEAKKEDCVLVFDEADALFARRFFETYSTDRMHNYMTNILMKEIERFDGVVIATTNREIVMDEAFDRRIILKLKFDIPGPEERAMIWRRLIPEKTPLAEDVDFNRLGRLFELTGGEIKNAILNAVMECAYRGERRLNMELLEDSAYKEMQKLKGREVKSLGFKSNYQTSSG